MVGSYVPTWSIKLRVSKGLDPQPQSQAGFSIGPIKVGQRGLCVIFRSPYPRLGSPGVMDVLGGWDGRRAGAVGPEPSGDPLHQGQFWGDGISQLCKGSCSGSPDLPRYPQRVSSAQKTFPVGRLGCGNGSCTCTSVMSGEMLRSGAVCCCRKNKSRNCQIKPRESVKTSVIQNSGPKSYNCPCLVPWNLSARGGWIPPHSLAWQNTGGKSDSRECFCSGRLRILSEELILRHICLSCCMNIDNEVRKRDLSP